MSAAAPETLLGLPVKPLRVVAPIPLPSGVALYLESGCWGCDGSAAALERVYRAADGVIRTEDLFRLPGATIQKPESGEKYIMSVAAASGGDDILLSVCEGPYCGGVGEQRPGATASIRHTTDGGITWRNEQTFDGGATLIANTGPSPRSFGSGLMSVLIRTADGVLRTLLVNYPSRNTDGIELRGQTPQTVRILVPVSGPALLLDTDGVRLFRLNGSLANGPQYDFSALPTGFRVIEFHLIGNDLGLVAFSDGARMYSAVVDTAAAPKIVFKGVLSWPKERPSFHRPQGGLIDAHTWIVSVGMGGGNVPALIDLDAATISPIAELVSRGEAGDRLLITAAKVGPFARVKAVGVGECVNVRETASLTATAIGCYADGVLLRELGQNKTGDGQAWTLVATPLQNQGWASTSFLETSGTAPSLAYHPAGTRVGDIEIDGIVAALESSADVPQRLIGWQKVACATPPVNGIGGPPECPVDVPDRTPVDVISGSTCEPYWRPRPANDSPLQLTVGPADRLYAVVRRDPKEWPGGDFALIYVAPEHPELGKSVYVTAGRVVGYASGCGTSPAEVLRRGSVVTFPPPAP